VLPKSKDIYIEFYLARQHDEKFTREVIFPFKGDTKISLKTSYGHTYRIEYYITKNFTKFGTRSLKGYFEKTVTKNFPTEYVVIIVICSACVLLAPLIIFFVIKQRKKKIYVKLYAIKPDKLGLLLEMWDQTQNSGCSIEWEALAAATEKNIIENRLTTYVAKENREKNRYSDILPCKKKSNFY